MGVHRSGVARVVIEPFEKSVPLERALVNFCNSHHPAILESSLVTEGYARYSIFTSDPMTVVTVDPEGSANTIDALESALFLPVMAETCPDVPFAGGWIGYLTYEAGLGRDGVSLGGPPDPALPAARFALYDAAAVFDHLLQRWILVALDWPAGFAPGRTSANARLAGLRRRLERAAVSEVMVPDIRAGQCATSNMTYDAYLAKARRAKRYIEAGDVYQVNLTQRFTARTELSPEDLYLRLRASTPSPFGAFLKWDDVAILSASPELFLNLRQGRVVTRPIKGTRPRGETPADDNAQRRALMTSEKDRAELNMIIDLLRNDLGRVCSFGSVRVRTDGDIEVHPTVFHRAATIEGRLKPECTWADLLRATFPGGSVTGAPKIRAMQIISELETTPRGVYCGSIGWIGLDGSMQFNLAIRTMVQVEDVVHLYAGGAIVADSKPEEEYEETIDKAIGMLRALGCHPPERADRKAKLGDAFRHRSNSQGVMQEVRSS